MKKALFITVLISTIITLVCIAQAKDALMEVTVTSITTKLDKNGNEYVRFFIKENRELSGVKYTVEVPVMCFSGTVEQAKLIQPEDKIKIIVKLGTYKGDISYTLRTVIQ